MKKKYIVPEIEKLSFLAEDVLMTSGDNDGEDVEWGDFISGGENGGGDKPDWFN